MSSEEFSEDLNDVERALRALRPESPRLDRDRLMFLAGQASAPSAAAANRLRRRPAIFWPSAAAAMTLVSLGLGMTLALRPPVVIERVVQVPAADRATLEDAPPKPKLVRHASADPAPAATPSRSDAVAAVAPRGGGQYLRLRDQAIAHGIDFVDSLSPVAGNAKSRESGDSRQELLEQMLHRRESDDNTPSPLLNLLLNLGEET